MQKCPTCQQDLAEYGLRVPPDAFAVCKCGEVLVPDDTGQLAIPTAQDLEALKALCEWIEPLSTALKKRNAQPAKQEPS